MNNVIPSNRVKWKPSCLLLYLEVLGFKELKPKQKEVLEKFVGVKD